MNGYEPIYINHEVACKLHYYNFIAWRMEVSRVIVHHGLKGYIDGSIPAPSQTVLSAEGEIDVNPSYVNWYMQDQLLLGWLRSTISAPVLVEVILSLSSATLLEDLHKYYNISPQSGRVVVLQEELLTFHQGTQSCSTYCEKMKAIADELASLGAPISDKELVEAISCKLRPSFEALVDFNRRRPDGPIPFEEFYPMLLSYEEMLISILSETQQASPNLHPEVGSGRGTDNSGHRRSHPIPSQGHIGGQHISQPPQHAPRPAQPPRQVPPPARPPQWAPPPARPPQQVQRQAVPAASVSSSSEESVNNYPPDVLDQ